MSKFQIIVIAIFVICIIGGVALFATYKGKGSANKLPAITVWGTFPQSVFDSLVQQLNNELTTPVSITYVQKTPANFDKDFIETLARGQGPDAILIPQEMMLRHADKLVTIPFSVFSERDYRNTYISQAELYLTSEGSLAIPFTIDPLVMYWNRDLFTNAGLATYPRFWDEFSQVTSRIDRKDVNSNIRQSAIALGEFSNITHAREILSALLMQAGNPITANTSAGVQSALGDGTFAGTKTSTPAINFFVQFANPRNPLYSWNRSLPESKSWFLSGSLATYFGFASELFDLRNKNPNIDFDVAPLPQAKGAKNRVTYGSMYGFSIVRTTANQAATFTVLSELVTPDALTILNKQMYLPPVRRDMLAAGSTDPYLTIFYDSALISRNWLDTNVATSNQIFQELTEAITSGKSTVYNAIQTANAELNQSLANP